MPETPDADRLAAMSDAELIQSAADSQRAALESVAHLKASPDGLQMDLLTVILRIRQLRDEDYFDNGHWLWRRVVDCDLPRLEGHLTPETVRWLERTEELVAKPGG